MPSLHTAWALLVFWQSRSFGRRGMVFGALHALFTPRSADLERERRQAIAAGGLGFLAWVLLLRFGTPLLLSSTVLAWAAAAVVCVPALVLEGRLYRLSTARASMST